MSLSPSEQERLRQLELELDPPDTPLKRAEVPPSKLIKGIRSLGILAVLVGCILVAGWTLSLLGEALKVAFVVGLGYLLFRYVVAPRLGLFKSKAIPEESGLE